MAGNGAGELETEAATAVEQPATSGEDGHGVTGDGDRSTVEKGSSLDGWEWNSEAELDELVAAARDGASGLGLGGLGAFEDGALAIPGSNGNGSHRSEEGMLPHFLPYRGRHRSRAARRRAQGTSTSAGEMLGVQRSSRVVAERPESIVVVLPESGLFTAGPALEPQGSRLVGLVRLVLTILAIGMTVGIVMAGLAFGIRTLTG